MAGQPVPSPITPAQTTYSGSTVSITTGSETVPSNFPVVVMQFTGTYSMTGTTSIQAGTYVGQRLLTMPSNTSTGYVSWVIHGSSPEKPVLSPIRQHAFGTSYCEVIDWVWDGVRWNLVNVFNPYEGPVMGNNIQGIINASELAFPSFPVYTDPGATPAVYVGATSRVEYLLTTGDLDYTGNVPFDVGLFTPPEGKLLLVFNEDNTPAYNVIFYDARYDTSSNLLLKTPRLVLRPNEYVLFVYNGTATQPWVEVCRSQQESLSEAAPGAGTYQFQPGEVNLLTISAGNVTGDTPTISWPTGEAATGTETMIWNGAASTSNIILEDEATTTGTLLKLTTATATLTPGSSVRLKYDAGADLWVEVARTIF